VQVALIGEARFCGGPRGTHAPAQQRRRALEAHLHEVRVGRQAHLAGEAAHEAERIQSRHCGQLSQMNGPAGARMGFLEARDLAPLATHPELEAERRKLEAELRSKHAGLDRQTLRDLPVMRAFTDHFKPFGKTYHVLLQLESVALKERPIPSRLCAVTALFMAELKHGLVAAGHDLEKLVPTLRLGASQGGEHYVGFGDKPIALPGGDLILRHEKGILSSVLQGPDGATPIQPTTRNVLYTLYAPDGIPTGVLEAQLEDLTFYVRTFAPDAKTETKIVPASVTAKG